jgi:hypothetical protein
VPSSTRRPDGSVTVTSFPISIGVTSTEIVTALGATFKVDPAIGDVATKVLASAGAEMSVARPSAPMIAAKRFNSLLLTSQFASMVSLL